MESHIELENWHFSEKMSGQNVLTTLKLEKIWYWGTSQNHSPACKVPPSWGKMLGKKEKPVLDLAVICVCCTGIPRLSGGAADPRTSFHSQRHLQGYLHPPLPCDCLCTALDEPGWKTCLQKKNSPWPQFRTSYIHFSWCSPMLCNSSLCPHSSELLLLPSNLLKTLIFTLTSCACSPRGRWMSSARLVDGNISSSSLEQWSPVQLSIGHGVEGISNLQGCSELRVGIWAHFGPSCTTPSPVLLFSPPCPSKRSFTGRSLLPAPASPCRWAGGADKEGWMTEEGCKWAPISNCCISGEGLVNSSHLSLCSAFSWFP